MPAPDSQLRLPVTLFGAVVVLFHLLAMLFPSGVNWGFHHLAFLPATAAVSIIILMAAALVPGVQERLFGFVAAAKPGRKVALWSVGLVAAALLFWLLRERTFFLGDGYLVVRNLARAHGVSDLPAPFRTAPLSGYVAYLIMEVLRSLGFEPAARIAWQIQSIGCGLIAIPLTAGLAGAMTQGRTSKWVMTAFLLSGGALQLFFGYVETYPPAYVTTILFLWTSLLYLRGSLSLFIPALAFGLLFMFHFGMLSLAPALLMLFVVGLRRDRIATVILSATASVVFIFLILWMCGYPPKHFVSVALSGGSFFLPLVLQDNWQVAYSLFSLWHVVDLVNAYMLLSPFLFIMVPLAFVVTLRKDVRTQPATIFLGLTVLGAAAWTIMTNFEVGMSRDWDVLAPLSACVLAFAVWGLRFVQDDRKSVLVAGMALVTLLHTAAWVAVNSDEDRSVARFVMLQDGRVRSQRAVAYACEDLAGFYRDRKQFAEALPFLEETVAIDSTNARRWLSLANVYQLAGRDGQAMYSYEQSVRRGIHDKAAFFNLGILYYNRNRLDDAIAALKGAAAIDSSDTLISTNLRMMLAKKSAQ